MSGYRDKSGFDPNASVEAGRPLRPYNWVQWTGAALSLVGAALALDYLLGKAGWVPELLDDAFPATGLVLVGVLLINSRREPGTELTPETRRKRLLIVAGAAIIAALAAAVVILTNFKGD